MADITKRLAAWDAKFDTEKVKQTLDKMRADMRERYQAALIELTALETKTKQTLDRHGVQTILYVPYLDYARQLHKLSRRRSISGESFALAAQVLLDKWAGRGLDPDVLAAVRTDVFDIGTPTP